MPLGSKCTDRGIDAGCAAVTGDDCLVAYNARVIAQGYGQRSMWNWASLSVEREQFHGESLSCLGHRRKAGFDALDKRTRLHLLVAAHRANLHLRGRAEEANPVNVSRCAWGVVGGVYAEGTELAAIPEVWEKPGEVKLDLLPICAWDAEMMGAIGAVGVCDEYAPLGIGCGLADAHAQVSVKAGIYVLGGVVAWVAPHNAPDEVGVVARDGYNEAAVAHFDFAVFGGAVAPAVDVFLVALVEIPGIAVSGSGVIVEVFRRLIEEGRGFPVSSLRPVGYGNRRAIGGDRPWNAERRAAQAVAVERQRLGGIVRQDNAQGPVTWPS
jgi:hypothetical protein